MLFTLSLLAIFGIAMAHVEGVVVVYLRKALGVNNVNSNRALLDAIPKPMLTIEKTREIATIVMLTAVAWLAGSTMPERGIFFLWTFAFWDLFYYVSLYVLIQWPPSLRTMDVLFLIPVPWIAPVWFPIGVSTATIIVIAVLYLASVFPH
jgi:hypothetical protein